MSSEVVAVERTSLLLFWVVLVTFGCCLVMVVSAGDDEQLVDMVGPSRVSLTGGDGGEGDGGEGTGGDGGGTRGRDDRVGGDGDAHITKEGEGSGTNGVDGSEQIFRDMPDLSGGDRAPRLRQSTLLEAFRSVGRQHRFDKGTSQPTEEEAERSDFDDEDYDAGTEAEQAAGEGEVTEEEAEKEVRVTRSRRLMKRRWIQEGEGISGWWTLLGDGPLLGYRRRPTAMRQFRTISVGLVC